MKEEKRICKYCHKEFTTTQPKQIYCSAECRKKYQHKILSDDDTSEIDDNSNTIYRTFTCMNCGKPVVVTNIKSKKTKFCCTKCERQYWRHNTEKRQFQKREFTCLECGQKIEITENTDGRVKFCSPKCARRYHRKHRQKT